MASSNYTENLHLSAWTDSDRPKRADFVSDNTIIDTQLGGHIANSAIHLTAEEKQKLDTPYAFKLYSGSGESSRSVQLDFAPRFVVVFKRNAPSVAYENSVTVINSGYASYGNGATTGVSLSSGSVTVTETAAVNGVRVSLNESGSQYTIVAFR